MILRNYLILIFLLLMNFNVFPQEDKNELFWKAAKNNDVEAIKELLNQGVEVDAKSEYGVTALNFAIINGQFEAAEVLLENGADPNLSDSFYKDSPFSWALYWLHSENTEIINLIKLMIDKGADLSNPARLLSVAYADQLELIKEMLEKGSVGADRVLMYAIKNAKINMLSVVLQYSQIDKETLSVGLMTALGTENEEIISKLKSVGATVQEKEKTNNLDQSFEIYKGLYEYESEYSVKIEIENGGLIAKFDGSPYSLTYIGKNTFEFTDFPDISLKFLDVEGQIVRFDYITGKKTFPYLRVIELKKDDETNRAVFVDENIVTIEKQDNWPSFKGNQASGIADGHHPPISWNIKENINLKWKKIIPGMSHSCPIVWDEKVFVITASSIDTTAEKSYVGTYGVEPLNDTSSHVWKIYCLDKYTGQTMWEKQAYEGVPRVKRHPDASQANSTPTTNGKYVVALFGSEGLVCYDFDGNEQWRRDLGILDAGWFFDTETQWGHSSSPIIYNNLVIVQCDRSKNSYIAAYDIKTGKEIWKTERDEISSWGTPTIYYGEEHDELVTNASRFIRGYNPKTGEELWRLSPNSEITVPTPVIMDSLIYVIAGWSPIRPIYAIKPGGKGDISLPDSLDSGQFIQWRKKKGGTYIPSPVAYKGYFYTLSNYGVLTCYDALTGEQKYREKIKKGGAFSASPVAADGKIYCTSKENGVFVIKAGPEFRIITNNIIGESCSATPAISDGMMFIRGKHHLFCFGRPITSGN